MVRHELPIAWHGRPAHAYLNTWAGRPCHESERRSFLLLREHHSAVEVVAGRLDEIPLASYAIKASELADAEGGVEVACRAQAIVEPLRYKPVHHFARHGGELFLLIGRLVGQADRLEARARDRL